MTSKQWAEVSIAFDTPPGERTEGQAYIARSGLCRASRIVSGRAGLFVFIERFCGRSALRYGGVYLAPFNRNGDLLRASLAALFAAMSQKERREVLGDF